jgi:hypothetical protein
MIMSRKVFIPSLFKIVGGVWSLKLQVKRTELKMKMNRPIKKGYKPGPGFRKDPKPYPRDTMMITIPNNARRRSRADSRERTWRDLMIGPSSRFLCPMPGFYD